MGDPRKRRKRYQTPSHPWQKNRIEEELVLAVDYGLKSKKEIWKMNAVLRRIKNQFKQLVTKQTAQSEKEKAQLILRLKRQGLISDTAQFDNILDMTPKNVLERRLETLMVRKGLARSMKQARQFIGHGHVLVAGNVITSPSYLVKIDEEAQITFNPSSSVAKDDHPERTPIQKKAPKERKVDMNDRSRRRPQRGDKRGRK